VRDYRAPVCADYATWPRERRALEARRLLAAAGYGPARALQLRFRHPNNETQRRIALAVASMWQAIGVRTELLTGDMKAHQMALQQGDFDVARAQWYAEDRDAVSFLRLLDSRSGPLNLARFRDAEFERAIDLSDATVDSAARAAALARAEARAMSLQPVAPLYVYVSRRLISPRVRGWTDNPRGVHLNRYLSIAPPTR
jgi:peptide/nickel transport system substrate-binding protein/oligopeptide transport system substrate-binding protein